MSRSTLPSGPHVDSTATIPPPSKKRTPLGLQVAPRLVGSAVRHIDLASLLLGAVSTGDDPVEGILAGVADDLSTLECAARESAEDKSLCATIMGIERRVRVAAELHRRLMEAHQDLSALAALDNAATADHAPEEQPRPCACAARGERR